jgi:hypothetical protein
MAQTPPARSVSGDDPPAASKAGDRVLRLRWATPPILSADADAKGYIAQELTDQLQRRNFAQT